MNQILSKTNFTSGQLSADLFARGDLGVFANGAKTLQNVDIAPTGGVSRRLGSQFVAELVSDGRIIPFEFNTEQVYLLYFYNLGLQVYKNDVQIATLETPWTLEQLHHINFTQSADTLLVVHPDVAPQQISRANGEVWSISPWKFYQKDGQLCCPYYNFYQKAVSLTPSATSGTITLTADSAIFSAAYVGVRIKINGGEAEVSSYVSTNVVNAVVKKNLSSTSASLDWEEQSFSALRGYPRSVTFHQNRMVIGGSKSLPNRLWLSQSSDLFNFDLGTGLDDESIEFAILSDQVNAITHVISSRHLLVFTTGAEWMVTGEPLTPTGIQLNLQTNTGSYELCSIMPQNANGATLFLSKSGNSLKQFLYSDVEQAYSAKDLTLLSADMVKNPVEMVFAPDSNILYIVLSDGTLGCLTTYRSEEVTGWNRAQTLGAYKSMTIVGTDIYFLVLRNGKYCLEKTDKTYFTDCSQTLTSATAKTAWSGLSLYNGKEISVVADGFYVGNFAVSDNAIELSNAAKQIKIGYAYEHIIEPLPIMLGGQEAYSPSVYRPIKNVFRLLNSYALTVNTGNKTVEVPLKRNAQYRQLDTVLTPFSGDVTVRNLGYKPAITQTPCWSIKSSKPYAFTLLSVLSVIKIKQQ